MLSCALAVRRIARLAHLSPARPCTRPSSGRLRHAPAYRNAGTPVRLMAGARITWGRVHKPAQPGGQDWSGPA